MATWDGCDLLHLTIKMSGSVPVLQIEQSRYSFFLLFVVHIKEHIGFAPHMYGSKSLLLKSVRVLLEGGLPYVAKSFNL